MKPYFYEIALDVDFNRTTKNYFEYKGAVKISFACLNSTRSLVFHVDNLKIENSSLRLESPSDASFTHVDAFYWTNDYERQFFIANFTRPLFKAGHNYTLSLSYTGYLKDDNAGFYRSSYLDNNGNKKFVESLINHLASQDYLAYYNPSHDRI